MTWENLSEGVLEAFTEHSDLSLSNAGTYQSGLTWIRPLHDAEDRKNYDHWYYKFVWYPQNRGKVKEDSRKRYAAIKADPAKLKAFREKKAAWERRRAKKGTARHERRMELQRLRRAKIVADPEKHARLLEQKRKSYARMKEKRGQSSAHST